MLGGAPKRRQKRVPHELWVERRRARGDDLPRDPRPHRGALRPGEEARERPRALELSRARRDQRGLDRDVRHEGRAARCAHAGQRRDVPMQGARQIRGEPRTADRRRRTPTGEELLDEVARRLCGHDGGVDEAAQMRERALGGGAEERVAPRRVEEAPAVRVQEARVPVGALGLEHERIGADGQVRAERLELLEGRRIVRQERVVDVERAALERER